MQEPDSPQNLRGFSYALLPPTTNVQILENILVVFIWQVQKVICTPIDLFLKMTSFTQLLAKVPT